MGRGNQYIQLVKVVYCKLPINSKQLPAFPLEVRPGIELRSQRWVARVTTECYHSATVPPPPQKKNNNKKKFSIWQKVFYVGYSMMPEKHNGNMFETFEACLVVLNIPLVK